MNHTPTPFYLAPIVDRRVAGEAGVKYQLVGANSTVATIYRGTDAAFILGACNAHHALVAALRKLADNAAAEYTPALYKTLTDARAALAALAEVNRLVAEQARAA